MKMKKMNLRSLLALLAISVSMSFLASCDRESFVDDDALPTSAQTFLQTYFPSAQIVSVMQEGSGLWAEYEVMLADGSQLSFNHKGEWRDVDCAGKAVPAGIVPEAIRQKVASLYPTAAVVEISRDDNGYEVELDNGVELEFNKKYVMKEIG